MEYRRLLLKYRWIRDRWCLFYHKHTFLLADRFSPLLLYQVLATLNSPYIYAFLIRPQASFLTPRLDSVSMTAVKYQTFLPGRDLLYFSQGEFFSENPRISSQRYSGTLWRPHPAGARSLYARRG